MPSITRSCLRAVAVLGCMASVGAFPSLASAQTTPAAMRFAKDYSNVRGFNYPTGVRGFTTDWHEYNHECEREMGYAQKLNLNLARVYLAYTPGWRIRPRWTLTSRSSSMWPTPVASARCSYLWTGRAG